MDTQLKAMPPGQVRLLDGTFKKRSDLNRAYMMSLTNENLLQNHHLEAGLRQMVLHSTFIEALRCDDDIHWGWESPTSWARGQFLGHWLSAAARIYASNGDMEAKLRADGIVSELARCQVENGGEWVGSLPRQYLDWTAQGKHMWAPHYVIHKTLMGLYDMVAFAKNEQALEVLENVARWFHRWTGQFSRQEMDDILDVETGGMLELWADLYGVTRKREHLDLISRYDRPRLFEPLLAGEDVLTNRHANTTIPEAHGAARAYEVTGDDRWRKIVEAYWKCAVTDRGSFCTGGQTSGEVWTPPFAFAARLGDKNQEHCTVYNMIRLADYLYRWTGDPTYADYIERNLYNGILAQQNPGTGMVSYFLPLEPGARKVWSSPTRDFWCCCGTLVQAHATHTDYIYYKDGDGLTFCQYINTALHTEWDGVSVSLKQQALEGPEALGGSSPVHVHHRPGCWTIDLAVRCERPVTFTLRLRLPWWLAGPATILVNGDPQTVSAGPSNYHTLRREWHDDTVHVHLPKTLTPSSIPDEPDTVSFLDGPIVLAGLCDEERRLTGDRRDPLSILAPDNELQWRTWLNGFRARKQERGLRFRPLYEVVDEPYTVYFPIARSEGCS